MPPAAPEARAARALYRALARAARALDAAAPPAAAPPLARQQLRAAFPRAPGGALTLSDGLAALRALNTRLAAAAAPPPPPPPAPAAPAAPPPQQPPLQVGQVVRHRAKRYRAVVMACDASCQASAAWQREQGCAAPAQPWFRLAVCTRDRPEAQITYAPLEALELLQAPPPADAAAAAAAAAAGDAAAAAALLQHLVHNPILPVLFHAYDAQRRVYLARAPGALLRSGGGGGGGDAAPEAGDDSEGGAAKTLA